MTDHDWLTQQFEVQRGHLRAVAYRMLGSQAEADDAVQEAWLRLNRADTSAVENLAGWLTTVVSRVSLDMLRTRTSRREQAFDDLPPSAEAHGAAVARGTVPNDPAHDAELADAVGPALQVVLDTLPAAERLAFVLHDVFGVPFNEIAVILSAPRTQHGNWPAVRGGAYAASPVTLAGGRRRTPARGGQRLPARLP